MSATVTCKGTQRLRTTRPAASPGRCRYCGNEMPRTRVHRGPKREYCNRSCKSKAYYQAHAASEKKRRRESYARARATREPAEPTARGRIRLRVVEAAQHDDPVEALAVLHAAGQVRCELCGETVDASNAVQFDGRAACGAHADAFERRVVRELQARERVEAIPLVEAR